MSREIFVIGTASDPAAMSLHDFLESRGFIVFDKALAEGSTLVVFDSSFTSIKRAINEAKEQQSITSPYHITVRKVSPRNLMVLESSER